MPSRIDCALDLARRGFRLFPLRSGSKLPAIKRWHDRATTDEAQLRVWFDDDTADHNIGVATGNGLLVVDVDTKPGKNGTASLEFLSEQYGHLPESLAVRTPSGGFHLYYLCARETGNTASRLGQGLDTRGHHGYAVGPGSTTEKGDYAVYLDRPIAAAPEWLVDLCSTPTARDERADTPAVLETDTPAAQQRAAAWLADEAELAIEGSGGDTTTFRTAARLRDFGITETTALRLLLEHWNERCSPPWNPDDLANKVANAYRYGQNRIGSAAPEAEFTPVAPSNPRRQAPPLMPYAAEDVKPRRWVLHPIIARGYVTVVIAPPGAGKSTLTLSIAAAIATGRGEIVDMPVKERTRVWYVNNEDDIDELHRRWLATATHFNIAWPDLALDGQPAIYLESGTSSPLTIAVRGGKDGRSVVPKERDDLVAEIKAKGIGVLIVDPFVETHRADENDNVQIAQVAALYRQVAKEGGCAVVIVHHTRKAPAGSSDGHAGNMDSGRGASALMGVARFVVTLYTMSEKDAKRYSVSIENRHRFVRLDGAKANLALVSGRPAWLERLGIDVAGESVGVLAPVALAEKVRVDGTDVALLRDVLAAMNGARRMRVRDVVSNMQADLPMYRNLASDTIGKRIKRQLESGIVDVDGFTLRSVRDGEHDHSPVFVEVSNPDIDDGELFE